MELLNPWTIIHHEARWDNWWVTIIGFPAIEKNKRHVLLVDLTVTDSKIWTSWISFCFHRKKTPLKKLLPPPPGHISLCTHSSLLCKGLLPKCSTARFSSIFSVLNNLLCQPDRSWSLLPFPSSDYCSFILDFTYTRISVFSKITLLGEVSYLKFNLS